MDSKDFAIILSLIENPIATNKEISELLLQKQNINMSEITVARRIKRLENERILQGASAQLNYSKLGLEMYYYVLILAPKIHINALITKAIISDHPYILYQNQIFGAFNGIFCQFALPSTKGTIDHHREIFENLKEKGVLLDWIEFKSSNQSILFEPKLEKFDIESMSWETTDDYFKAYKPIDIKYKPDPYDKASIEELDMLDLILLRELTLDCRRSNQAIIELLESPNNIYNQYAPDIMQDLPLSKQTVSRRIIALKENGYHRSYAQFYNRKTFGMFNQSLFIFERDDDEIHNFRHFIETNLPFPGRMLIAEHDILLWLNIPIIELMKLTELITAKFDNIRVCLLNRKPVTYFIWAPNFDSETKSWKDSREYIQSTDYSVESLRNLNLDDLKKAAEKWEE